MEIFVTILSLVIFTGLLFYFRYTDARNISVHQLKDYLKQSEQHIEKMLRQKEKEFNDKIIASEIAVERLNRLAGSLQTQVDAFDEDLELGERLLKDLRSEVQGITHELAEYKKIRADFVDIEEQIVTILAMKEQATEGAQELLALRRKMEIFEQEYKNIIDSLQDQSKQQLTKFYQSMQSDLDQYLSKSRVQLEQKDTEMSSYIEEIKDTSDNFKQQLVNFQNLTEHGIATLQERYQSDIEMAQTIANNSMQDIYDMWEQLKDKTARDKIVVEEDLARKEQFFKDGEAKLREDVALFTTQIELTTQEYQNQFFGIFSAKELELDQKIHQSLQQLDHHSDEIQNKLDEKINQKTTNIEDELSRIYTAFVEQESSLEERIKSMRSKLNDNVNFMEQQFKDSLSELQSTVDTTKNHADNILALSQQKINEKVEEFEQGFKQKLYENIEKIEETFRNDNHNRILQSIQEVTENLEQEYKNQHQSTVNQISQEVIALDESLQQRKDQLDALTDDLHKVFNEFDKEKDNIITMTADLEKDREQNLAIMKGEILEHVQNLNTEVQNYMHTMFAEGREVINNENIVWQERYETVISEARDAFSRMDRDIKNIHHLLDEVKDNTLSRLRDEAERFQEDSNRKLEDLKQDASNHMRHCKDDLYNQIEDAKQEAKNLRDELWKQEKEIKDLAQKDFDRLSVRVKEMEKQFQMLFKKSERLDKTDDLVNKINSDYNDIINLKKDMNLLINDVKSYHQTSEDHLKEFQAAQESITQQLNTLATQAREAGDVREYLQQSIAEARGTAEIFEQLNAYKEQASDMSELLQKNLETYNELLESLSVLETRKSLVDQLMSDLNNAGTSISHIQEMAVLAQDVQEKIGTLQTEMRDLAGDQTKIYKAVSRFNELDHMITHIEQEEKRLQKMMDWIAKALNKIDQVASNNNTIDSDDEVVKNILRLHNQNWGVTEIAKNLNLSQAYVDLMIDRYK